MNAVRLRLFRDALLTVTLAMTSLAAQDRSARTLDSYVVDVEAGNATLFVSPTRESLLIDTGNVGQAATRDADRIMAAFWIKVAAREDGSFTVAGARNGFAETYAAP